MVVQQALAGSVQLILEGVGHFGQLGPYATIFGNSPYTIGFVEAHGLALLVGLLLLRAGRMGPTVQDAWLGMAVAVIGGRQPALLAELCYLSDDRPRRGCNPAPSGLSGRLPALVVPL